MATEYVLVPKHKYDQLEKDATPPEHKLDEDATPKDTSKPPNNDNADNGNDILPKSALYEFGTMVEDDADDLGVDDSDSDSDDDYDTTDLLQSFSPTELKYVQPIITRMEDNLDTLTWNKKTGEIIFQNKPVQHSNIIELLKDTFTANLHPTGKMEFFRGLDMLDIKLNCIKHSKNKALLSVMKGKRKVVHKMHSYKVKKVKPIKQSNGWISWV